MLLEEKQRFDFELYNDANAFTVITQDGIESLEAVKSRDEFTDQLKRLHSANMAMVMALESDSPVQLRVLIGDELTEEENEWIGHAVGVLKLTGGRCVLSGGFEPSTLLGSLDEDDRDQDLQDIEVTPGLYRVDIYTYLCSPNFCLDLEKGVDIEEFLVAWFKQDFPDKPAPLWMEEFVDPDNDGIELEDEEQAYIDFLIQLTPVTSDRDISSTPLDKEGLIPPESGKRRLDRFPYGVRAEAKPEEEPEVTLADALIPLKGQIRQFIEPKRELNRFPIEDHTFWCSPDALRDLNLLFDLCIFPNSSALRLYDFATLDLPSDLMAKYKRQKQLVFWFGGYQDILIDWIARGGNDCQFELIGVPTASRAAGPQLFGGVIRDGQLEISTLSVKAAREDLDGAIRTVSYLRFPSPVVMESDQASESALTQWKSTSLLRRAKPGVQIEGATLIFDDEDLKMQFFTELFDLQYRHLWEPIGLREHRNMVLARLLGEYSSLA